MLLVCDGIVGMTCEVWVLKVWFVRGMKKESGGWEGEGFIYHDSYVLGLGKSDRRLRVDDVNLRTGGRDEQQESRVSEWLRGGHEQAQASGGS